MRFIAYIFLSFVCISCNSREIMEEKHSSTSSVLKSQYQYYRSGAGSIVQDGFYKVWNEKGKIIYSGNYEGGKRSGQWIEYRSDQDDNDVPRVKWYMKDDKRSGSYEVFDKKGNIRVRGVYKDDEKTGVWKEFDEKGNVLSTYEGDQLINLKLHTDIY